MTAAPGRIVAAVLLPPLGAYLATGPRREFALACLLTVLAWIPGMLFALYLVLRPEPVLA